MAHTFSAPFSAFGNPNALKRHIGHKAHLADNMFMRFSRTIEEACDLALDHMLKALTTHDDDLDMTWDAFYDGDLGRIYFLLKRLPPSPFVAEAVGALLTALNWGEWEEVYRRIGSVAVVLQGTSLTHPRPMPYSRPTTLGDTQPRRPGANA